MPLCRTSSFLLTLSFLVLIASVSIRIMFSLFHLTNSSFFCIFYKLTSHKVLRGLFSIKSCYRSKLMHLEDGRKFSLHSLKIYKSKCFNKSFGHSLDPFNFFKRYYFKQLTLLTLCLHPLNSKI